MTDQEPQNAFEQRPQPRDPDPGRLATIIFGAILLVIGAWFFVDRTLGIDLPDFDVGSLWPLILVGLGVWILLGAGRRSSS